MNNSPKRLGRMLMIHDVCAVVGLSKAQVYKLIAVGYFPTPVRYSRGCVRWKECDIEQWLAEREKESPNRPKSMLRRDSKPPAA